ncbi:MAG TPA: hypothetical protein VN327_08550 [Pseudonocardiaceae bacterium]|nr:hypothetical protein [Pseudonocardiaceae bacterium]
MSAPVNPAQLGDVKALTDKLLGGSNVRVLVQRAVRVNGVPGYYYLYTPGEPGSASFGVHAHYFLFSGSTMHVLVLQALPDTDFTDLGPTFDRIARSYRIPPILPPAAVSTAPGPVAGAGGRRLSLRPPWWCRGLVAVRAHDEDAAADRGGVVVDLGKRDHDVP